MIISIHQPDFLPWLGFFNKVALSDLFVIADHVQYRHHNFQNRNRIKTPQGPQWLTVPIVRDYFLPIHKVGIVYQEQNGLMWNDLHLRTIQRNYGKAPFYDSYIGIFEKVYRKRFDTLADCNIEFLKAAMEILGISVPLKRTSEMTLYQSKSESVVEICRLVGADTYLSGAKGTNYLENDVLQQNGIKLVFNNFEHPKYNQQFMKLGFIEGMSIIDLIFNHGPESLAIVKSGFKGFEPEAVQQVLEKPNF